MTSAFTGGMLWRLLALTALLLLVSSDRPALGNGGRPARISPAEQDFIRDHWRRPIPPQGTAPARFSPIERSLAPVSCGTCHPISSRTGSELARQEHGTGHLGPARRDDQERPGGRALVLYLPCPAGRAGPADPRHQGLVPNPDLDTHLQSQGVVCASCHVRGHQRFGPPRRDGTVASRAPRESLPHNGLTRTTARFSARSSARAATSSRRTASR